MRITNQTVFNGLVSQIQTLGAAQASDEAAVSSGLAFTNPSDDPTGMETSLSLISQESGLNQFSANASTALAHAQASSSGLSQLQSLTNQVSELATHANNGTDSTSQLRAYAAQVDQYLQQAVQLGNTQFEGNYLYAGTAVTTPPFATTTDSNGVITAVTYQGNSQQATTPISSTANVAAGTSGATNQALATLMNNLIALRDAMNNGDTAGIASAGTAINSSQDEVITAAATSTAVQSRITAEQSEEQTLGENLQTTIANTTDTDIATASTKLSRAETAYQAVLDSSAKIMQTTLLNYVTTI
jgi:flagellar hook-associated protein 3 FlgL